MNQFKLAITCLEARLINLISELKSSDFEQRTLDEKIEIELAIKQLKFADKHNINVFNTVKVLPKHTSENCGEFFEYRVMNDHETDDVTKWSEAVDEAGEKIIGSPGDLLVKS